MSSSCGWRTSCGAQMQRWQGDQPSCVYLLAQVVDYQCQGIKVLPQRRVLKDWA
jgi:hypothetical protein